MSLSAGNNDVVRAARVALSPSRLRILRLLTVSQMSFSEIAEHLGFADRSKSVTLSYHLKRLAQNGLVNYSVKSRSYSLTPLGRAVVEVIRHLEGSLSRGKLMMQTSDYSAEYLDRNTLTELIVGELRVPYRLARRVSLAVENSVESLSADFLPRWLVEDMLLVELASTGLPINRLSSLAHSGPTLASLQRIFNKYISKGEWWHFTKYVYSSVMSTYVIDKAIPSSLRKYYYYGELDIYHPAWALTHIFSLAQGPNLDESLDKALLTVVNDLVIRERSPSLIEATNIAPLPETIYHALQISNNNVEDLTQYLQGSSTTRTLTQLFTFLDKAMIGYPLRGNGQVLVAAVEEHPPLFTRYSIWSGQPNHHVGTYYFVGLNVYRLVTESGGDWGAFEERTKRVLSEFSAFAQRTAPRVRARLEGSAVPKLYYLLAPVGAIEAAQSSGDKTTSEQIFFFLSELLHRLRSVVDGLAGLGERTLVASSWPSSISNRLLAIDSLLQARSSLSDKQGSRMISRYSNYLIPPHILQNKDMVAPLSSLVSGGILVDLQELDMVSGSLSRDEFADLLQSYPILIVA